MCALRLKNVSVSKTIVFKSQDGILGVISNIVLLKMCLRLILISSGHGILLAELNRFLEIVATTLMTGLMRLR